MNMQTVLASAIVSGVLIGYFMAGDTLMQMIMLNLADESQFQQLLSYLAITAGIALIMCAFVVSDEEDAENEGGLSLSALKDKAKTLASGVLYSNTGYAYLLVAGIVSVILLYNLIMNNLENETATKALIALAGFNLLLPVLTFFYLD